MRLRERVLTISPTAWSNRQTTLARHLNPLSHNRPYGQLAGAVFGSPRTTGTNTAHAKTRFTNFTGRFAEKRQGDELKVAGKNILRNGVPRAASVITEPLFDELMCLFLIYPHIYPEGGQNHYGVGNFFLVSVFRHAYLKCAV